MADTNSYQSDARRSRKMEMARSVLVGILCLSFVSASAVAENRFHGKPLIGDRYQDNGDGTVTDLETSLQWMRCSIGQTWTGKTCKGTLKTPNWFDALHVRSNFAGHLDWHLPTLSELRTLLYCEDGNPAKFPPKYRPDGIASSCEGNYSKGARVHPVAFPNTPINQKNDSGGISVGFWTTTDERNSTDDGRGTAYYVNNYNGAGINDPKNLMYFVRLVRGSR